MVEYVSESETRFHSIRAESLVQMSNALEKIEVRMDRHDKWHRDVLEKLLRERRQNGIAIAAVVVATLALLVTTLSVITTHH